jgi:GNAT superfamily N-acetyltransferase
VTDTDVSFRLATKDDVGPLLSLLPQITSRPGSLSAKTLGTEESTRIVDEMGSQGNVHIVVGEIGDELVAALTIAIIPNLTYAGRPWSIIENVVVARGLRGKGVGKKITAFAFELAERKGCYKAQLLSGPNDDQVGFYRSVGMKEGSRGFKKYFVDR